jgi:protein-disulfide isomerase
VKITRRELALAALALGAGAGTTLLLQRDRGVVVTPAQAADPSVADLMQPNPLGEMAMGSESAPITVIEYASMTCPHCAHFSETTFPELKKRYIDTGKVRFLFREFPLDQLAFAGFLLARCGGPDKYFPMIETLFAQQRDWVVQKPLQPMRAIASQASDKFGVNSTPTFFVNGKRLAGALSIEEMEKEFAPYLKS